MDVNQNASVRRWTDQQPVRPMILMTFAEMRQSWAHHTVLNPPPSHMA